jgi:hypothetical protein
MGWAIAISAAIQLPLAFFLGHAYDMPLFMATGYLVGSGLNPYLARDLSAVFHSPLLAVTTSIGYPPPWPLIEGLIYRLTYAHWANFFVYNLALKLPVIAANICMALLVMRIAKVSGADKRESRGAGLFMLLNPLIILTTAAWGQFDSVTALLALGSLYLLFRRKPLLSVALLALAVSLKPTALALVPLVLMVAAKQPRVRRQPVVRREHDGWEPQPGSWLPWGTAAIQGLFFILVIAALCAAPFLVFRWDAGIILRGWSTQFHMAGCLSWLSFLELVSGGYALPSGWGFLGYLWVPVLAIGFLLLLPWDGSFEDLLDLGLRVVLLFFLSRTWLSEPNVNLILPLAALLAARGRMGKARLHALWLIPLAFMVFNGSLPQLLAPLFPRIGEALALADGKVRTARLIARSIVSLAWIILGWRIIFSARGAWASVRALESTAGQPLPLSVSLILPTYNEAESIVETIERAETSLGAHDVKGCEIIVVDDDSPDGTGEIAAETARRFSNVRVINRPRRSGLSSAILDGMQNAGGDVLAVMDADLQHPPESLPRLLTAIQEGSDLAIMSRYAEGSRVEDRRPGKLFASFCAIGLTHLLLPVTRGVKDPISGFFMLRRDVISNASFRPMGFKMLPEILARGRCSSVREVPFTFHQRMRGRSKMESREPFRYLRLLLSLKRKARA